MKILLSMEHVEDALLWRPEYSAVNSGVQTVMDELKLRFDFRTSFNTTDQRTLVHLRSSDIMLTVSPLWMRRISNIQSKLSSVGETEDPDEIATPTRSRSLTVVGESGVPAPQGLWAEHVKIAREKSMMPSDVALHGLDAAETSDGKAVKPANFFQNRWVIKARCPRVGISLVHKKDPLMTVFLLNMNFHARNDGPKTMYAFRLRDFIVEDKWYELRQHSTTYLAYSCESTDVKRILDAALEVHASDLPTQLSAQEEITNDLVHVKLTTYERSNEEDSQELEVHFNRLHMEWNPETVAAVQTALAEDLPTGEAWPSAELMDETPGYQMEGGGGGMFANEAAADANAWNLKLTATMHHFSITLNKEIQQRQLITLAMQDAKIVYADFGDRATARGSLGNLTIRDMRPEGQLLPEYREILGLEQGEGSGTSLLVFNYEWYSPESPLLEQKGFNSRMKIDFSPMKFVLTLQLTFELLDYLWAGLLGTIFLQTAEAATEALKPQETQKNLVLFSMERPSIIIPQSPTAKQHLRMYAERIVMDHDVDPGVDSAVDHKQIVLTGMGLADWKGVDLTQRCVDFVIRMDTTMVDPGHPALDDQARVRLLGEIADVDMQLSHEQYVLIMDTFDGNIFAARPDDGTQQLVRERSGSVDTRGAYVSYAYDSEDDRVWTTKYVYKVGKFSLTLKSQEGEGEDLALLEMVRLKLVSERNATNVATTDVTMTSLDVTDLRGVGPEFLSRVVQPQDAGPSSGDDTHESPILQITWTYAPTGSVGVGYRFGKVRSYIVPVFVVDMTNFITRPVVVASAADRIQSYDYCTTFEARSTQFVFVDDIDSLTEESPAILISLDMDFRWDDAMTSATDMTQNFDVQLHNIHSFVADVANPQHQQGRILQPFDTTVKVCIQREGDDVSREVLVHVGGNEQELPSRIADNVDGFLSYQIFQVANSTARRAIAASSRLVSSDSGYADDMATVYEDRFQLNSKAWEIAIVDDCDCDAKRLAIVRFDHIAVEIDGSPDAYTIAGDFTIQVDRIVGKSTRQALLDPWMFQLQSTRGVQKTVLSLQTTNILHMFLSNEYIALVSETLSKWGAAYTAAELALQADAMSLSTQSADAFFDARETEDPLEVEYDSQWSLDIPAPIEVTFADERGTKLPVDVFKMILDRVSVSYKDKSGDANFDLKLGTFEVHDLSQRAHAEFFMLVQSEKWTDSDSAATSSTTEDLVSLQYHSYKSDTREDAADIDVTFKDLHLAWNPETVATIVAAFFADSGAPADEPESSKEAELSTTPLLESAAWNLKLTATMHHFSITLNKEIQQRQLITLAMQDAKIVYADFGDRATARGSLGNLTIRDMRPEGQLLPEYREILGLEQGEGSGTSLLVFNYEWYSPESPLLEQKGFNSRMKIDFSPMKFVLTLQLTFELLDYLWAGLLGTIFLQTAEAATEALKPQETQKNLVLFSMERPSIIIPQSPTAKQHLRMYAERIVMDHDVDPGVDSAVDHKQIVLTGMGLADWKGVDLTQRCVDFVIRMDTTMVDPGHPALDDQARVRLLGEIADVDMQLSHEQYVLIMDTFDGNIFAARDSEPDAAELTRERSGSAAPAYVSYSYDNDDDRVWTTKYVYKIGKFSLTLKSEDREGEDLALLEMVRLKLVNERLPDNVVQTDVSFGSFAVYDGRAASELSPFRCIWRTALSKGDESAFVVQVIYLADGRVEYLTTVRRTEVVGVPSVYFQISSFFTRDVVVVAVPADMDYLEMISRVMDTPAKEAAVASAELYPVSMKLVFSESRFRQPYDTNSPDAPMDPESPGIELALNVTAVHDRTVDKHGMVEKSDLTASDIEVFRDEYEDGVKKSHRILPRTSVKLTQEKIHGGSQNITVKVDSVDLCISFQSGWLARRLMETWTPADDADDTSETDSPRATIVDGQAPPTTPRHRRVGSREKFQRAVQTSSRQVEDVTTNEFVVEAASICVTFINDKLRRSMPSLRLNITDAKLHVFGRPPNIHGKANFVTGAQYYNIKHAEWQQLFILPRIEIVLKSSKTEHSIDMNSVANPSLVVTDAVLSTFAGLQAALEDSAKQRQGEQVDPDSGLTTIENHTGAIIHFCTGDDISGRVKMSKLLPNEKGVLDIRESFSSDETDATSDTGEWEFEEQLEESAYADGLVTWTPFEMMTSTTIENCYQEMLQARVRQRPQLTTVSVSSGKYIDGIDFGFSDDTTQAYGAVSLSEGSTFSIFEGEYLVRVDWRVGSEDDPTTLLPGSLMSGMQQVQFMTSSGRTSRVYGKVEDGTIQSAHSVEGSEIYGLVVAQRGDEYGSGLQDITQLKIRRRWIVDTEPGRCVDVQLEKEFVTKDPSINRRVKRRQFLHMDYFVEQEQISLRVEGPYKPCLGIPANVVGRHIRTIQPDETADANTNPLTLVVVVHCEKGCMVVSCESSLRVMNETMLELEILAWHFGQLQSAGTVKVGESWPVPMKMAGNGELRIRPWNELATTARSASPLLVDGTYQQTVECTYPGEVSIKLDTELFSDAELVPDKSEKTPKELAENVSYQMAVYPPLIIRNYLPSEVFYIVFNGDATEKDSNIPERSVKAGKDAQVYTAFARHVDGVTVNVFVAARPQAEAQAAGKTLDGWSGHAIIVHDPKKEVSTEMVLAHSDGERTMTIQVEFSDRRTITLYAPLWLQNRTGLALRYQVGGSKQSYWSDGGSGKNKRVGSKRAEVCMLPFSESDPKLWVAVRQDKFGKPENISELVTKPWRVVAGGVTYTFNLQVDMAPGELAKTKLVTLTPYFAVANNLGHNLIIREANHHMRNEGASQSRGTEIVEHGGIPVAYHPQSEENEDIQFSIAAGKVNWCKPVNLASAKKDVVQVGGTEEMVEVRFGAAEANRLLVIGGELSDIVQANGAADKDVDLPSGTVIGGAMPTSSREAQPRQIKLNVNIPGFDVTFRDMDTSARRQFVFGTTERSVRYLLNSEFLSISIGQLEIRTLYSQGGSTKLDAAMKSIQIRDKCADCCPDNGGMVLRAGQTRNSMAERQNKHAFLIHAEQAPHPSVLKVSKLVVSFPDVMMINMNDTWVFVVQAVANHIASYLGSDDAADAADLIRPMQSDLMRVETSASTVYVKDFLISAIEARVSFERSSDFRLPVAAIPDKLQWLKFAIVAMTVELSQFERGDAFGTWSTLANLIIQHESPQIKALGMDMIINQRFEVLSWKEWAGRTDGGAGREMGDVFRIGLKHLTGATSTSLQNAAHQHGFRERTLTNDKIFEHHWRHLRMCRSQQDFDRQINHMLFDWDSNHCGIESRACIAIGVINRSCQEIHFHKLEVKKGSDVQYLQQTILPMPPQQGDGVQAWQPAQTNVLFCTGSPVSPVHSGDVELLVECSAFRARFTDKGGQFLRREDTDLEKMASSGTLGGKIPKPSMPVQLELVPNFVVEEPHKWWSKFIIVIGDKHSDGGSGEAAQSSARKAGVPTTPPRSGKSSPARSGTRSSARKRDAELQMQVELDARNTRAQGQTIPRLLRASKTVGRTCFVKLHNRTEHRLERRRFESTAGQWTPDCEPPETVHQGERDVPFGTESTGFMSGTSGMVVFGLQHPRYGNLKCVARSFCFARLFFLLVCC